MVAPPRVSPCYASLCSVFFLVAFLLHCRTCIDGIAKCLELGPLASQCRHRVQRMLRLADASHCDSPGLGFSSTERVFLRCPVPPLHDHAMLSFFMVSRPGTFEIFFVTELCTEVPHWVGSSCWPCFLLVSLASVAPLCCSVVLMPFFSTALVTFSLFSSGVLRLEAQPHSIAHPSLFGYSLVRTALPCENAGLNSRRQDPRLRRNRAAPHHHLRGPRAPLPAPRSWTWLRIQHSTVFSALSSRNTTAQHGQEPRQPRWEPQLSPHVST